MRGSQEPLLPPPMLMMEDDAPPYGERYSPFSMSRGTNDVMVYDTTIGDVYDEQDGDFDYDDEEFYDTEDGAGARTSYGFESIGRRDKYDDDDDDDMEEFYNRGSRNVPPYSELGDNDDF
jgi:hypothetical protein